MIKSSEFNTILRSKVKESTVNELYLLYNTFILDRGESLLFHEKYQVVNCMASLLNSKGVSKFEIHNFIEMNLSQFQEFNSLEFVETRYKMLNKFDKEKAYNFLNLQNSMSDVKATDLKLFVNNLFLESEVLMSNHKFDEAFKVLCRSNIFAYSLEIDQRVFWLYRNHEQMAKVCKLETGLESMESYLVYIIQTYFLNVLKDYLDYPPRTHLHKIPSRQTVYWWKHNRPEIENILFKVNPNAEFDRLLIDVEEFVKNYLPKHYGIPDEYLNEVESTLLSNIELDILKENNLNFNTVVIHELPNDFHSKTRKKYLEILNGLEFEKRNEYLNSSHSLRELGNSLKNNFNNNLFSEFAMIAQKIVQKYVKNLKKEELN